MGIMDLKVKDRQTSFINVNLPDFAVLNSDMSAKILFLLFNFCEVIRRDSCGRFVVVPQMNFGDAKVGRKGCKALNFVYLCY